MASTTKRTRKVRRYKSLAALRKRYSLLSARVAAAEKSVEADRAELWVLYAQERLLERTKFLMDIIPVRRRWEFARILGLYRKLPAMIVSYERDNWMGRALTVRNPLTGEQRVYEYQP